MKLYVVDDPRSKDTTNIKVGFFLVAEGNDIKLMARDSRHPGTLLYVATISEEGIYLNKGLPEEWSCVNKNRELRRIYT